ncbi:precorrin-6Y C5,15-methyltransferase (decarboxylating) subunit CbiT [Clostridium sp.]|uniref:precorrin-6Y C5,15-methyltransferase (decarboxylating) subunit CbiT n=1 Tax=Clostridium sp. TaxID=1506 RepID=UPI0028509E1F|nr:precorrin-6Y C5,15-methyltransferase (decarboxylating) subunit CbiT [Clostridium sp.]MDR3597908.1 precorrin-6Y C5,15-methyltransferase (decarboxylating) subunit CbiT [Clostridium sp.]
MIFIKDEEFIRGKCPMTKEDIRILSVIKMNIKDDSLVLDIGSGTGTIAVQASKIAKSGKVLAIEKDDEAYNVTQLNIEEFECENIKTIKQEASKVLDSLIYQGLKFDSIFIGGSSGHLEEILLKVNTIIRRHGTIVMNFITLDNAYRALEVIKNLDYKYEISLVNISKNRENTLMMIANNPIYIIQCIRK